MNTSSSHQMSREARKALEIEKIFKKIEQNEEKKRRKKIKKDAKKLLESHSNRKHSHPDHDESIDRPSSSAKSNSHSGRKKRKRPDSRDISEVEITENSEPSIAENKKNLNDNFVIETVVTEEILQEPPDSKAKEKATKKEFLKLFKQPNWLATFQESEIKKNQQVVNAPIAPPKKIKRIEEQPNFLPKGRSELKKEDIDKINEKILNLTREEKSKLLEAESQISKEESLCEKLNLEVVNMNSYLKNDFDDNNSQSPNSSENSSFDKKASLKKEKMEEINLNLNVKSINILNQYTNFQASSKKQTPVQINVSKIHDSVSHELIKASHEIINCMQPITKNSKKFGEKFVKRKPGRPRGRPKKNDDSKKNQKARNESFEIQSKEESYNSSVL